MKRVQEQRLEKWISQERPKPLIIRGARQVGKSTLVRNFAESKNLDLYEVNLENYPELSSVFATKDVRKILTAIETIVGKVFKASNALLFLDEIQSVPEAIPSLRSFFENKEDHFPVICAGSLLEFALENMKHSMPVGRIEFLFMGPLKFEEFLEALGEEILVRQLRNYQFGETVDEVSHKKLCQRLRQFFAVGGMPEAVDRFRIEESIVEANHTHRSLIETYRDDFAKYGLKEASEQSRMLKLAFNLIPARIGEKIKFSMFDRNARSSEVKKILELLVLARVAHKVIHTSAGGVPLGAEARDSFFKMLFLDIGLMNSILGLDWIGLSRMQETDLVNEGKIAEQFIGQELLFDASGYASPEIFYWQREAKSSSAEVDFVTSSGPQVFPIEVKSGASGSMKSLHQFVVEKKSDAAIRFDLNPPSVCSLSATTPTLKANQEYELISLPLYLASQLPRLLREYRESS